MRNIILFGLAITLLPITHSFAETNDLSSIEASSIDDFEVAKVVPEKTASITPTTTPPDTNAEIIPPQSSVPAQPPVDSEIIKKLLREHIPQFQFCYQNALDATDKPETLKGSINLKFTIATSGKVANSEISSQNFHSEKVQSCIKNVLEGIKFPVGGKSVSVNQPMNLNSVRK